MRIRKRRGPVPSAGPAARLLSVCGGDGSVAAGRHPHIRPRSALRNPLTSRQTDLTVTGTFRRSFETFGTAARRPIRGKPGRGEEKPRSMESVATFRQPSRPVTGKFR